VDVSLILLIVAAVLFFIAALGVNKTPVHLGWLGAFFTALALALGG
jgi:hypothetical protein